MGVKCSGEGIQVFHSSQFIVYTYEKGAIHYKRFYLNLGTATQLKGSENSRHGREVILTLSEEMFGKG